MPYVVYGIAIALLAMAMPSLAEFPGCPPGWFDVTGGNANYWACGDKCTVQREWTDDSCNCACRQCPPGTYSQAGWTSCGDCIAGYICGAGSTSATEVQCPPGQFSVGGQSNCALAPSVPSTTVPIFTQTPDFSHNEVNGLCSVFVDMNNDGFTGSLGRG